MAEVKYETIQYRLRAAGPMPKSDSNFVLQGFMGEESVVEMFTCTESLPDTSEFRGQGGELVSASFSRLNVAGGSHYQGKKVYNCTYVTERNF